MSYQEKYNQVIEDIVNEMKNGVAPWQKPFFAIPKMNYTNFDPERKLIKDCYKGINRLLLWQDDEIYYLTFNQAKKLGAKVKKGSKARLITHFCIYEVENKESEEKKRYPSRKFFYVFRLSDIEGLERPKLNDNQKKPDIEDFIKKVNPELRNNGESAYYVPESDYISIPQIDQFTNSTSYYSCLLHELTHWTGNEKRLARIKKGKSHFSEKYSFEELIAEFGAALLCARFGIEQVKQSASYIQGWHSKLSENKNWLTQAITRAEEAVNYLIAG